MTFKVKGSISSVDSILMGGVVFDNEKLQNSKNMPKNKFTINEIDASDISDLANNTLVTNFGKSDDIAGMLSFNTGDWADTDSAPVKLMMRVINDGHDSDWVTIFDSSKTTITWSSIALAGQTKFIVPNLDFNTSVVFVNGILQYPGLSYTTYGGTIRFTSKLNVGDQVFIVAGKDVKNTKIIRETIVATNGQVDIPITGSGNNNLLFVNGVLQYPSSYTISNQKITLKTALYENDNIFLINNTSDVSTDEYVATASQKDFVLSSVPEDAYVFINGIMQYDNAYSINGTTLSFVSELYENDNIFVYHDNPGLTDKITSSYNSTIYNDEIDTSINVPYFHFSELQVFINGVLQNPDNGAYTLNGTEITLSSPLQVGDDIHVIVYNSPVHDDNLLTKSDLTSYASKEELEYIRTSLEKEGINFKWQPHLPSIEVAYGIPRRSLSIWQEGSTSTNSKYWLYPIDGTIWTGSGTLGTVPDAPFYKLDSNKDVITWVYTASEDNVNSVYIPYKFGSINIFINGVLQSQELGHYSYSGQYVSLNGAMSTGDNLVAILGKLIFNTNPYITYETLGNYATKSDLSSYATVDNLDNFVKSTSLAAVDGFKYIGSLPSINSLRMTEPTMDNQKIYVDSYYSGSFIGGGVFIYDQTDTISPDDGGMVFVTSTGKRWKRFSDPMELKAVDFGAKGDGITDDYNSIQNMLNYGPEGCVFVFEPGKTYYNAFANDNTYKAPLLRNMWIRSKGATFKFNGCKLKRRLPEWNFNNLKNNYNTGSFYTDDHTALIWLNGGDGYIFENGEIDCNVPITNMVDVNGNKTSQTNYAVGTCMEFGIYASLATNITFNNMYIHNSVFPYYLEDCTNIFGNNLRIEYTAQASARVDGSDLMLGGGFKTIRCTNVDIKGVSGFRNANCTVEIEPNSDNVYVQGYSKYDLANSLVIVFSRNVEFDWKAYNVTNGSGLTIRGGSSYETYNIRGKLYVNTATWMGANIFNSASATTNMSGIFVDITSYNCKKHGIGVYNSATDPSLFIHADSKVSLWDDRTAESAVRYHGNVGGRISGSAHNFLVGGHKTGASTTYMVPVFDFDVRDRVANGLAIGTGAIAECARVDHIDRTAITTSTEMRILPVTVAGSANPASSIKIYGGSLELRTNTFLMPNIQATTPSTSGTAYVSQDTVGQPTYTVKLYRP